MVVTVTENLTFLKAFFGKIQASKKIQKNKKIKISRPCYGLPTVADVLLTFFTVMKMTFFGYFFW